MHDQVNLTLFHTVSETFAHVAAYRASTALNLG